MNLERSRLLRAGGVVLLVGVMLGIAAIPAGAVLGAGARWTTGQAAELPGQVVDPPVAQLTRIYANDGKTLITTFYDQDRHDVPLAGIAPVMQQAIVAAEDTRFYEHGGVDLRGVARALVTNTQSGSVEQGASTLTMQLVRNALKEDMSLTADERAAATEETAARKLREIQYAIALEQRLTKQQILHNYLNIVYFGDGAYGVEAASRRIFGTTPARLSLAQAALIAGIVRNPEADNPVGGDPERARTRQVYVLDAMVKAQMITQEQRDEAVAEKLTFAGRTPPNGCVDASGATDGWGFFCDYLRRWWQAQPQFGATAEERDNALRRGGYTVVTTLDPEVQKTAAAQARAVYSIKSDKVLPIAAVQPGTGKVLALAVNRKYGTGTAAGETVNPLISGGSGLHGYQAGSTFKMFTMLAALEAGLPLDTGFTSPSRLPTRWSDSGPESCNGQWCPANANPSWMDGDRTMWNGFGRSVNTYFVQLEEQIGPAAVVAMAQKLGISLSAPSDAAMARDNADAWGSFTLGVAATTPLELASAYAAVAAEGTYCAPLPVASITGPDGAKVPVASNCQRVISEDVARAATDAARCPVGQQSSFRRCDGGTAEQVDRIMGGRPVAGKTGSTDDNSTETFAGFTRSVAAAGIAADPTNPANHVGSAVQREVINAVARTIRTATGGEPYGNFVAPSRQVALGE